MGIQEGHRGDTYRDMAGVKYAIYFKKMGGKCGLVQIIWVKSFI